MSGETKATILTDTVYLRRYEADASAVWADIEFLATYFRDEYPAPDSDAVPADVLDDVEVMAPLLANLRKMVERRLDRNAAANVAAKVACQEGGGAMTRRAELKPCPFCGAEPGGVDGGDIARFVGCYCGATGPVRQIDAEAIEHWNRRTTRSEWAQMLVYAANHQLDVLQDILTLQDDSAIESLARRAHADLSAAIGRARRAQEGGQG